MCKNENFTSRSEPNGALFWGNDPKFILVTKNAFHLYIICLCLKSFAKCHIFWDKLWNWQLKFVSFLRTWRTGTWNQNSRPLLDLFRCHESMTISELANELPLKIAFFEISIIVSVYVKFQYLDIQSSVLETKHTLDSWYWLEFNFKLKSLFWLTDKKLTFWMILPLGSKLWNWSSKTAVNSRRAWLGSYKS